MSADLITISELSVKPDLVDQAVAAWRQHHADSGITGRVLYRGLEDSSVMELAPLDGFGQLDQLREDWKKQFLAVGPFAESDFRRQILHFVEAPKPAATALPDTPYVQLRHVEVPPRVYKQYRAWREETIFDVVRTSPQVESFEAYHSVATTEPGVMFVSGFSVDPDEYVKPFTDTRYQDIVRQAGDTYITGGDNGLYTRLYARVDA